MSTDVLERSAGVALTADWQQLSIEHLQLDDRITNALRNLGIEALGEAERWAVSGDGRGFRYIIELVEAIRQFQESIGPEGVDWPRYWSLRGWRLHHLAAAAREFALLAEYSGGTFITRALLGNGGVLIRSTGTETLSDLIEALRTGIGPVRGLGRTKLEDLFRRLLSLSELAITTGSPVGQDERANSLPSAEAPRPRLPDDARSLSISVLGLGVKEEWLRSAGYLTVGDLVDAQSAHLSGIGAIGSRTLTKIRERLLALEGASDGELFNWSNWASSQNMTLIPSTPVGSAQEMLAHLPSLLATMRAHLKDQHCQMILSERVSRLPRQQSTLEEIARSATPSVSRERIRQKEAALLRRIAGAMIWGRGDGLEFQIHPSFSLWWRKAAEAFHDEDDVAFPDFVERLATTWSVGPADVLENIAFISAVVTGDAQLPSAFRAGATLNPALLRLNSNSRSVPLCRFRLERMAKKLDRRGIADLGQLVDAVFAGTIPWDLSVPLGQIASVVRSDGGLNWAAYQRAYGLPSLPTDPPDNSAEFVESFAATVARLLELASTPRRAARIFEIRTRHPEGRRPTLDATARVLGTHGPSIKREESVLLQELHRILVDRDFAEVPIWLDRDWLRFIDQALELSASVGNDYGWFSAELARSWELPLETVELAAPGLWAVFTGYPEGRLRRGARRHQPAESAFEPMASRIRLRGFRQIH